MKYFYICLITLLLAGCAPPPPDSTKPTATPQPPRLESDSGYKYRGNKRVEADFNVYKISGMVVGDVNSLTRQTKAARGSSYEWDGYGSGSYFGPQFSGKGFIRILVNAAEPTTELASPGSVVILKSTDTKATALLPGDIVTFKCRAQYEVVAAVANNEDFDEAKMGTWELDYCRMFSPLVRIEQ